MNGYDIAFLKLFFFLYKKTQTADSKSGVKMHKPMKKPTGEESKPK